MKPHLFSLPFALVVALSTATWAQTPPTAGTPPPDAPPAGQRAPRHEHHFLEKLNNLTDQQKAQIKQIKETVTDPKARHEQIMQVLTPEQKQQLKKMMEDWHKNHPHAGEQVKPSQEPGDNPDTPSANNSTPQKVAPLPI